MPSTIEPKLHVEADPDLARIRKQRAEVYSELDNKYATFTDGFVYFVTHPDYLGMVKIGSARDYESRVGSANTWCPFRSYKVEKALYVKDGYVAMEKAVHAYLEERGKRHFNDGKKTEWFYCSVDDAVRVLMTCLSS